MKVLQPGSIIFFRSGRIMLEPYWSKIRAVGLGQLFPGEEYAARVLDMLSHCCLKANFMNSGPAVGLRRVSNTIK